MSADLHDTTTEEAARQVRDAIRLKHYAHSTEKPTSEFELTELSTSSAVSGNPGILDCARHSEKMSHDNAQSSRVNQCA